MASLRENLEWIGGAAVVMSLLLVAFEIRQNTNALAAQAVFELNQAGRDNLFMQVSDRELTGILAKAESDPDSLTAEERFIYHPWVFSLLNWYESAWNQHIRGIISDDDMDGWISDYCQKVSVKAFQTEMNAIGAHSRQFLADASQWCD